MIPPLANMSSRAWLAIYSLKATMVPHSITRQFFYDSTSCSIVVLRAQKRKAESHLPLLRTTALLDDF